MDEGKPHIEFQKLWQCNGGNMIRIIITMYMTLMSTIIAGILNSIWCKMKILEKTKVPMDGYKNFTDGKRIFGDNKTWKGFVGYIVLNIMMAILWGFICKTLNLEQYNFFYFNYSNTIIFNVLIGFLLGLAYALFELPNSFLKRRLDIIPGKNTGGMKKYIFIFLDQADSIFGCVFVVWLFYSLTWKLYLCYVLLGAFTHIVINILLYYLHLRKNKF